MERPQQVGLVSHEAASVGVRYRIQFQGGVEKKVGLCFDIDLLTGSEEGNCSTKGAAASVMRQKARSRALTRLGVDISAFLMVNVNETYFSLIVVGSRLEDLCVDCVSQLQG
jgi:hypothetical protein